MLKKFASAFTLTVLGIVQQPAHSQECNYFNDFEMAFLKTSWQIDHDLFALHVIPKCGTHYIQRVITLMTKQDVESSQVTLQNLTEFCNNNKILRTFQPYDSKLASTLKSYNHKVISVVRDPRDALISHVFYMRNYPWNPNTDNTHRDFFIVGKNFNNLSLEEQIDSLIEGKNGCMSYVDYYKQRVGWALNRAHLTIKFEELLPNEGGGKDAIQLRTVKRIAKFINIKMTDAQLQYVVDNMYVKREDNQLDDGRVFERGTKENWRTFLNKKQIKKIKERLNDDVIIPLGYEKNKNW